MKTKFYPLWLLLVLFSGALSAQPEDLTRDTDFFKKQAGLYQQWLEHSGFSPTLRVKTVEVEPQLVTLYLAFPTEHPDSVAAAWEQVRHDYARLNTGLQLEQELFYKMLHMFELRQSAAAIQLYDTYDTRREPCFFRAIHTPDGVFRVDSSSCMARKLDIHLAPGDLRGAKKHSVADFQKQYTQTYVFDRIHQYAKNRYERKTCDERAPSVSAPRIDGNTMRFEAIDLCKEVLKDEENPAVCAFLNKYVKPCNWIKREKLTFTFVYQAGDTGFTLKCEVEGKVGSGYYENVGRGGYLDMEIDFDGYLEDYADKLRDELKQALLKP